MTISTKDPNERFLMITIRFHGKRAAWFLSLPFTDYDRTLRAARQEFSLPELHAIYISRTEQKMKAIRLQIFIVVDQIARYKYLKILSHFIIKNCSHKKCTAITKHNKVEIYHNKIIQPFCADVLTLQS
jgi:hypothetical protein